MEVGGQWAAGEGGFELGFLVIVGHEIQRLLQGFNRQERSRFLRVTQFLNVILLERVVGICSHACIRIT